MTPKEIELLPPLIVERGLEPAVFPLLVVFPPFMLAIGGINNSDVVELVVVADPLLLGVVVVVYNQRRRRRASVTQVEMNNNTAAHYIINQTNPSYLVISLTEAPLNPILPNFVSAFLCSAPLFSCPSSGAAKISYAPFKPLSKFIRAAAAKEIVSVLKSNQPKWGNTLSALDSFIVEPTLQEWH